VAGKLGELLGDDVTPAQFTRGLARALGLSRRGWNALEDFRRSFKDGEIAVNVVTGHKPRLKKNAVADAAKAAEQSVRTVHDREKAGMGQLLRTHELQLQRRRTRKG
jgi:hypothetical protein